MEQAKQKRQQGKWVLVDMEKLPVRPEVAQVRQVWESREIWFLMPKSGTWRRGKVKHIYNSGAVSVVVYEKGTPGIPVAFEMEHIPLFLKPANS